MNDDLKRPRLVAAGLLTRRLQVALLAVVVQTLLLVWVVSGGSVPDVGRVVVVGLSVVVASMLGLDAKAMQDTDRTWWRPRRPAWALGGALAGANVGIVLAYTRRRLESHEASEPTGRWRTPAVVGAVLAGLTTALFQSLDTGSPGVVEAVVLVTAGNAIGFALVAVYYDSRYVTGKLDDTGHGWLFRGYHWPVLCVVIVPANVLFVVLYLWRRQTLLQRAAKSHSGFGDLGSPDLPSPENDEK